MRSSRHGLECREPRAEKTWGVAEEGEALAEEEAMHLGPQ